MEKYEFEQELKEAVLIKRADKSIALVLDGEEVEISCPKLCSMNINEEGSPCLVSDKIAPKDGKYSIMAFSLDRLSRKNKDWICLKPAIFEEAVGFFITNQQMEEMVNSCMFVNGKSNKGKQEPDFMARDAYIELNVPDAILNAADGGWMQISSLFLTAEKAEKYRNVIAGFKDTRKRIIFLTVFQHGLNDKMHDFFCKELSRFFGMDMDEKIEFWIADLKLEPDGITMLSYQNITDKVLLS